MMDATDMSTPVTRGELREELTQLRQEFQQAVAPLATKVELEMWGGALLARIESGERRLVRELTARIESGERRLVHELTARIELTEQRLYTELARHTGAIQESMTTMIAVIDEKYADLPARVKRLEGKVFAPRRR